MVGWHHQLDGYEDEQAPGLVMDREAWHAAVHWATESDMTESELLEKTICGSGSNS